MRLLVIAPIAAWTLACTADANVVSGEPGAPLPGLSPSDSGRFVAGRALFNKVFSADEGLGPAFNENQCSACHTVPAVGGTTGFERITKVSRYDGPGACDLLSREGGENIRTNTTPRLRAHGVTAEVIVSDPRFFSILTLPVEIGASRRALAMLDSTGLLVSEQDRRGARSMLTAAAMTYVAAAVTSVLTLLYYLSIARRSS